MKREIKFELPMMSQTLSEEPEINHSELDIKILLKGYDLDDNHHKCTLHFRTVLCFKHTSEKFTKELFNSYDKVVELIDSEWIKELKKFNNEYVDLWNLKHYIVYLDSLGLYQFICSDFNTAKNEF